MLFAKGWLANIIWASLSATIIGTAYPKCDDSDSVSSQDDKCKLVSGKKIMSYQEAVACYRSFSFKEEIRSSTLATLRKTLPFYAFIDIIKDSPDNNVPSTINLYEDLDIIEKAVYSTELDFQMDVKSTFNKLNDGHTSYTAACFNKFIFVQPFTILATGDISAELGQKVIIYKSIANEYLASEYKKLGLTTSKYENSQILMVNGVEVYKFLEGYANRHLSNSRDPNSRFNELFSRYKKKGKEWEISDGGFPFTLLVPETSSLTYDLMLPDGTLEKIEVPYFAFNLSEFKSGQDYYEKFCLSKNIDEKTDYSKMNIATKEIRKLDSGPPIDIIHSNFSNLASPLYNGYKIDSWMVDESTAALFIENFLDPGESEIFMDELYNATQILLKSNARRLLIDLRDNVGGDLCYVYYLMEYLFPSTSINRIYTDMHVSPLLMGLIDRDNRAVGHFNFRKYTNEQGLKFTSAESFIGGNVYRRGDTIGHYTSKLTDSCPSNPLSSKIDINKGHLFSPQDVLIITNSICHSSCATFVNALQDFYNIKTVAVGGILGRPSTAASLQGGAAYSLKKLTMALNYTGLAHHHDAPNPFIRDAEFTFTIRQAYPRHSNGNIPTEFSWTPADYHLKFSDIKSPLDPYGVLVQISKGFSDGKLSI